MKMKNFIIMIIVASSISYATRAQKKVGSLSFNSVLKVMLKHDVKEVTIQEAAIKRHIVFIDAREKKEFDVSHIRNAIYAGYKDFNLAMLNAVSKQSEVIVYCSIGKRSEDIT